MSELENYDNECVRISHYTEQVIKDKGYPLEIHHVTTEDGYINSIYRIPHGLLKSGINMPRPPVLLVHGLMSSMAESVLEDRHLAYYLADNGFDVWLANCRGTTYSRGHIKYHHEKDKKEYWNFSIHEIGYYDHPSFIEEILKKTGYQKLFYIGVSQGTTSFIMLMSTKPEYNEKIALACLLCPAVKFEHARAFPLKFVFCQLVPLLKWISDNLMTVHDVPYMYWIRKFAQKYATPNTYALKLYVKFWELFAGHRNPQENVNIDYVRCAMSTPNTAAFKQLLQYSQIISGRRFARFDYGEKENMEVYKSVSPPLYDISKVTAPVALFYSKNDMFYGVEDIDELAEELSNCVGKHLVENDNFNHMDFIYNDNVIPLLYTHVSNWMKKFIPKNNTNN